jgi:hypothetical protein
MPFDLHFPLSCFHHHMHFCGLLYFHLNNILLPCVLLHYLFFHKMLLHSFVFLWLFNEHLTYWCSSWSYQLSCMPTSFTSTKKLYCWCSSSTCIMIYHSCKLHILIVHFSFCTFQRWCWMWRQPYNQWLNIQHAFMLCSFQLFFYFYSFQQFHFLLLLLFMLIGMRFLFLCYFLWFFNCTICIHAIVNSRTLKMHTTFNNKCKLLLMVTPFFFVLELPAHHIHFFIRSPFLITTWSLKLI